MGNTPRQLKVSVLRGDAEPAQIKLDPDRIVTIGRGLGCTVRVTDPLVDFQHARLFWSPDVASFVVHDLGSAYGTFVDGQPLRSGVQRITAKSKLRLGDTEFEVHSPGRLSTRGRVVVLSVMLLFMIALLASQWEAVAPVDTSSPRVDLGPIRVTAPQRYLGDQSLVLPPQFLWDHGISGQLSLAQVADHEWFEWAIPILVDDARDRLVILSFDTDGTILLLGDTPNGQIQSVSGGLPEIVADGITWRYEPESRNGPVTRGRYRPVEQSGAVVWYRERPPPKPDEPRGLEELGPLQVRRFAMKGDKNQISVFLRERGVNTPVHYIVCEGAFEGVRYQVLDDDGQAQLMAPACLDRLSLDGGAAELDAVAVALTPSGYYQLLDALMTFYAGEPEGLFLDPRIAAEITTPARADPGGHLGNVRLDAISTGLPVAIYDPWPRRPVPAKAEGLVEDDDPQTAKPARPVEVTSLPYPGIEGAVTTVPTPSCALRVEMASQIRTKKMFELWPAPFLRVWCNDQVVLTAPYATGITRGRVEPDGPEIAVKIALDGNRIRSAILGWRN